VVVFLLGHGLSPRRAWRRGLLSIYICWEYSEA